MDSVIRSCLIVGCERGFSHFWRIAVKLLYGLTSYS